MEEKRLFTIAVHGTRHKVLHWTGYGVVCPSLATTNGSYKFLLKCMRPWFVVEPGLLNVSEQSELEPALERFFLERGDKP